MVRPLVLGLVVEASTASMRRAMEFATSCWGGIYFPLLLDVTDADIERRARPFAVDALIRIPAEGEPASTSLVWPGWRDGPGHGPLDGEGGRWSSRLQHVGPLITRRTLDYQYPGLIVSPTVQSNDSLLPLMEVARSGAYGSDPLGRMLSGRYVHAAHQMPTGLEPSRPHPPDNRDPITLTALHVTHGAHVVSAGFVTLDPDDPAQTAAFWNLRAAGHAVYPWPCDGEGLDRRQVSAWLRHQIGRLSGDPHSKAATVSVWQLAGSAPSDELVTLIEEAGALAQAQATAGLELMAPAPHPLRTPFTRSFSTSIDEADLEVRLDMPDLTGLLTSDDEAGTVAVQISVQGETLWPRDLVASVPCTRALAASYDGWATRLGTPLLRPGFDGPVVAENTGAKSTGLPILVGHRVTSSMFEETPWTPAQTDVGHFTTQVAALFGGLGALCANQPGMRAVLGRLARSPRGMKFQAMAGEATQFAGDWNKSWLTDRVDQDYGERVARTLLDVGLVVPAVELTCPNCRNSALWEFGSLDVEVICRLCHREVRAGVALTLGPRADQRRWRYLLAKHIDHAELAGALAVVATAEVLEQMCRLAPAGANVSEFGIGLRNGKAHAGDIDVLRLCMFQGAPTAFIGEVKAGGGGLNAPQLRTLSEVQQHVRSRGLECIIVASTLSDGLTDSEIEALRSLAERSPGSLYGPESGPCLPLVLTKAEIDAPPRTYGLLPWRDRDRPLGETSLRRNLGLIDVRPSPTGWTLDWS